MPPGPKANANRPSSCFLTCLIMLWMAGMLSAQNLVPNPNFETFEYCPSSISQIALAIPWVTPTEATPDYYHSCCDNLAADVPTNWGGYQQPLTGQAYAGCYFRGLNDYREYLQVELATPMEPGICYQVGFFMNAMDQWCGANQAGVFISAQAPSLMGQTVLPFDPQITGNGGFYTDTGAWMEISGLYPALGGERYITIGNFKNNFETIIDPTCTNTNVNVYYYIDSVYVIEAGPLEELPLELGPPVETCDEYEIDGESGDVYYTWSDGSHGHTLTVNTTDVYSLTITQGCALGIDSVEVTFLGAPPVQLNPGFISMCEGESYTITLDPDAGDYTWNDGSTESEYTITEPGLYSVTLDDGCNLSSDDILVEVTLIPLSIYLGNDTTLCAGDNFEITLDPGMNDVVWQDGSNSSTYTIEAAGIYAVTISNECGEASDEIEVTGLQAPLIDLGPDTLGWCEGDVIHYDFDPDLGDFLWSDDSFEPFLFIFTTGIYSVTVTNQCGTTQDMVTVYEAPEPSAGLDDTIHLCSSALPYVISLEATAPVDEIIWSTGATTSEISVSGPGTYAVTISNPCFSVSDMVYVDILSPPVVTLPNTQVMCLGDTLVLDANVPLATYLWQDGSTLSTFEATTPGWYAVTVTTSCGADQDSTEVTNFPTLVPPDLGPDLGICAGGQITLFANAGNGTYQWNDLSTADTLLVTNPGVYSVTVQDQCASAADTVEITSSNVPPVVDLPSSMMLCQGQSVSIDANLTGVSYLWSDGTTDPSLTVTIPGSYSLTVSNSCGSDRDSVMIMDGGPSPVIDLGSDIQLCPGDAQMIVPVFADVDNWLWQDGTTDSTFLINTPGLYTVEVSNGCGSANDTVSASLLPVTPPLSLGNDTSLCSSETLLLEINIPGVSITWFDGSHSNQITVAGDGIYTAEIENTCGVSSDTLIVTPLPDIPLLNLGPDQFLCVGEVLIFNPGIPDVQYLWQDGTTASSYSTTQTGWVILTISNECGASTDSLLITESTDGPQLNLGPDVTGCDGSTVTIQSGITGVTYTWQDGSTNPFFQVTDDAELMLHIANACGMDDDTIVVHFITPPEPNLGPDTVLCGNEILILTSNADQETSMTWQDGSHASVFIVSTAGVYSLEHTNFCGAKIDSVTVTYAVSPALFSLGPDVVLCPGESILLNAPVTMDQLLWQDGSDSAMITAANDQLYSLTIFNTCGSTYDEINVDIDSDIPVVPFGAMMICPGDVLTLDASQLFDAQYSWNTGASVPSIDVVMPGEYMVTVMTPCYTISNVADVIAAVDCEPVTQFFIPNVFSPNGDDINEVFTVQFNDGAEVISVTGDIFDRWGNLVFSSQEQPFSWDGAFNGKLMNPGVYVYRFTLVYSNGLSVVTKQLTGDITLMR